MCDGEGVEFVELADEFSQDIGSHLELGWDLGARLVEGLELEIRAGEGLFLTAHGTIERTLDEARDDSF